MKKFGMLLLTLSLFGVTLGCGASEEADDPTPPVVEEGSGGGEEGGGEAEE